MLPRPSVCWHVCKIVKEEGLSPCPPPDPTAASYGGSQAAGALPGLRKVEAPIAGPQVFSKLVRAMGVLVPLSERFSAGGEETSSGTATVHSTAATAAAVSKTSKISWSHAGAISWSRVPGFCGFCRAPTSCWSCPTGDPPWLPLSPQSRVHLRLLWDFYAASLPTSCSSMQEAIRMDNIFALRAEAALLSLISRALGFTSLSQSSLRVAEICDINDAGEPNPAWGRNHPLAGAKWTHLFCLDTSAAKLVVQEQQHKRQHQQQQQKIGSRHSNHCRTSVELGGEQLHEDTYMGEGASVSQCRTPVAGARCVSSSSEVLDTLVSAERPADSEVPAEIIRAAGAVNSPFAMACSKQALERLAAVTPHQRTQQRHCCSAKQNASWRGQDQLTKEQQQTYPLSRQPPRQQQVQWQCLSRYSKQQATQGHKKHREWHLPKHSPAACLRGLNSPTGALGEAVAVCFADLHAAKAKLAPLFQEGALEAATEASAVVLNDEAAPQLTNPAGGQCSYLQPLHNSTETLTGIASALRSWTKATEATLEETRTSGRIIATAVTTAVTTAVVATKAAIAAAKSALKRALVWGGSGADAVGGLVSSATVDAVMWLPSPVSGIWRRTASPGQLVFKAGDRASSTVRATASISNIPASRIVAPKERFAACPQRAAVSSGQWRRSASTPSTTLRGSALILQPLWQALAALEAPAHRKWGASCRLVKRQARWFFVSLQQLLRLPVLWETPCYVGLGTSTPPIEWEGSRCTISRSCRSRGSGRQRAGSGCTGSLWTTQEVVRPRGSTSTCHLSPGENTAGLSSKKGRASLLDAGLLLPTSHQRKQKQVYLAEKQILHHHLQVGSLRSPVEFAAPSSPPSVASQGHVASAHFRSGTLPVVPFTGIDYGSKRSEGNSGRGGPCRQPFHAGGATRAAVAGAEAAAATALWGTGISRQRRMGSPCRHLHVSYQTENEEKISTYASLQTISWERTTGSKPAGFLQDSNDQTF